MANLLQRALADNPAWRDAFRAHTTRVGFSLHLTRAMAEFLSAVADGVVWDRQRYGSAVVAPNNFLATSASLVKRGLIEAKPVPEREANKHRPDAEFYTWNQWNLTPAGELVVAMLVLTGLFVEADAAIEKRNRKP